MIGRLTGTLVERAPEQVLLDVAGVGYTLQIPLSTFYALSAGDGAPVSLHVHTHVREDALQLYGFASAEERTAFEQLIAISGVGPRMALAVLSGIGVSDLVRAVLDQDRGRLQKIPGVGRKTAERVLLELKDRLAATLDDGAGLPASPAGPDDASGALRRDALSALANLGYTRATARGAVDAAVEKLGDGAALEAVLRASLGRIVR